MKKNVIALNEIEYMIQFSRYLMITLVYPRHMFPQDFWRLSIEDRIDGKISNVTTKGESVGLLVN